MTSYAETPGWPKPEPGTPCAECGAALHGFPCIHHNDSCSYFKEGDLWAESEAVSTMSNLDELTGEAVYREWWRQMWASSTKIPPRQWEQLTAIEQTAWNVAVMNVRATLDVDEEMAEANREMEADLWNSDR